MHSDVKSGKSGTCPECGMMLVKKKNTLDIKGDGHGKMPDQK